MSLGSTGKLRKSHWHFRNIWSQRSDLDFRIWSDSLAMEQRVDRARQAAEASQEAQQEPRPQATCSQARAVAIGREEEMDLGVREVDFLRACFVQQSFPGASFLGPAGDTGWGKTPFPSLSPSV